MLGVNSNDCAQFGVRVVFVPAISLPGCIDVFADESRSRTALDRCHGDLYSVCATLKFAGKGVTECERK